MATFESNRIHSSVATQTECERRAVMVSPSESMDAIYEQERLARNGVVQMVFLHGPEDMARRWLDCPLEVGHMAILDTTFKMETAPTAAGQ
jgi:hypothetical protein